MAIEALKTLFTRDLHRLRKEIELYGNENNLWRIEKNISNSAGKLIITGGYLTIKAAHNLGP
jgi:hypothetical protein